MKRLRDYYVTIIIIAAVIVINIAAFGLYISNINNDIENQTEDHLAEIMEEASTCIELKIEQAIHELEMTAYYIGFSEDFSKEELLNNVQRMTEKVGFETFDIVDANGIGLVEKGSTDYAETKFFDKALKGNVAINDLSNSEGIVDTIRITVPIVNEDGEFAGVYLVKCNLDRFSDLLDLDSVSTKGKAFIIKRDGTVLSKKEDSSIQSISDILNNQSYENTLKSYIKSKSSGVVGFANGEDSKRYICYSKTDYNNWEIIMVVSSSSVEANISDVTDNFVFLGIVIGLMLALLIAYFIYTLVSAKSKSTINLRRYYMVSKYSEDIVFDYSCVKDTLYCNENWKKIFGYELPTDHVKENLLAYIAEGDREQFKEAMSGIDKSEDLVQFRCKVLDSEGNPVECTFKVFGVKDNLKKMIKIVGVIEKNIR